MKNIFVTGIGTDIGKTIVSAVLVEALQADYWKPVQSGGLDYSDTQRVSNLISNTKSKFFPEAYRFKNPVSPHLAAEMEGTEINPAAFVLPETNNRLIIEGAGGLMVPLTNTFLMLDLIKQLDAAVVLVSKNYLGSINHTLLSASVLKAHHIPVLGIIFSGNEHLASESVILSYSQLPLLGKVEQTDVIDKSFVKRHAEKIKSQLLKQY
jgi:dethiobiotin synthetase